MSVPIPGPYGKGRESKLSQLKYALLITGSSPGTQDASLTVKGVVMGEGEADRERGRKQRERRAW